jgi:hypothetical protein
MLTAAYRTLLQTKYGNFIKTAFSISDKYEKKAADKYRCLKALLSGNISRYSRSINKRYEKFCLHRQFAFGTKNGIACISKWDLVQSKKVKVIYLIRPHTLNWAQGSMKRA